jgi:hypothetical protein
MWGWTVIKRIGLAGAVALGTLIVSLVIWDEIASQITSDRLHAWTAYWNAVVNSEVRVGGPRDQAERWLSQTVPSQTSGSGVYDPQKHAIVASAETVNIVGMHFPCSAWIILIEIQFSPANRVTARKVTTRGICL